jgi:Zn-dependent protease
LNDPHDDLSLRPLSEPPAPLVEFLAADAAPRFRPAPRMVRLSILLFCLTCVSTFWVGMTGYAVFPPEVQQSTFADQLINGGPQRALIIRSFLWSGLCYAGPLMGILLLHELGHYLQARRYGVPAIPPLFIPMPLPPFGTMGAVIVQSSHHADRKAMFDIAISGPLAGLCLALPVAWLGILQSEVRVFEGATSTFGDPLILKWMIQAVHGPLAPNEDVLINPLLMAGWVGVFITALNLAPIGQLDGGHILYCLIGRKAHVVAWAFVLGVVAYMAIAQYWIFSLMVLLMVLMGVKHPPTTNDQVPLGPVRVVLGWLTLAFLLIGLNPRPIDRGSAELPSTQPPAVSQQMDDH